MVRVRGFEPLASAFQVRSSAGLSYTLIDLERAAGLEPACLPVRSRTFIHLNYARALAPAAGFEPASFSVNSRARSPRVLDRKKWWRQSVTLRPRRSCKDHLHPCAVPVVPRVGFEPTSPRLQRGAFTRLASSAQLVRASVIETESPEWRSGARPSSYVRMVGSGRNRTSCPQGPRLQRGDGTGLSLWHFPCLVAGPGVAPGRRGV